MDILFTVLLQVATLKAPTIPVVKFDTHQVGQGVVYNVIVYDPVHEKEAAYSPVTTYADRDVKRKFLSLKCVTIQSNLP